MVLARTCRGGEKSSIQCLDAAFFSHHFSVGPKASRNQARCKLARLFFGQLTMSCPRFRYSCRLSDLLAFRARQIRPKDGSGRGRAGKC